MKKNTFTINRKHLKAALRLAATNDIRYYLNSVYVEVSKTSTTLVTTDGHCLLAINDETENAWEGKLLIPKQVAKRLTTGKLAHKLINRITVNVSRGNMFFADDLTMEGVKISFKSCDGVDNYPKWRDVLPDEVSGDAGNLNPAYVQKMNMAAKDAGSFGVGGNYINVVQGGKEKASVVYAYSIDGFLGLIMPYRTDVNEYVKPRWAK